MPNKEIDQAIRDKRLYFVGERLPSDWYEAFRIWLPLAEVGDAKAQYNIGRCYSRGDGVDKDEAIALAWYLKAAAQNDPRAYFNIFIHYSDLKELEKAETYLNRAIELGEPRALRTLVERTYLQGKERFQLGDKVGALQLFQDAFDKGVEYAELGIAACGVNISVDHTTKTNYYSSSQVSNGTVLPYTGSYDNPAILFRAENTSPYIANMSIWLEVYDYHNPNKRIGNAKRLDFPRLAPGESSEIIEELRQTEENPVRVFLIARTMWKDRVDSDTYEYFIASKKVLVWEWEKKKKGCFVLTVCYGDYDEPIVRRYRQYRDNHLAKHKLGRKFISWYYTHGPKWAEQLTKMPKTRSVLRRVFSTISHLLPR